MFCQIVLTGGFNAPLTVPQNLSRNLPLFHRERTFFLKDLVPDPLDILPQVQIRLLVDQINCFVVLDYMCKLKERSRRELCNVRNANGNLLDAAICEQVKHLADHSSGFMKQLEKARSAHAGNRSECETRLSTLRKEQAETQRKITALIDSLADFGDSTAAVHLKKRIEELNAQDAALSSRIRELESLTDEGVLAGMEFDLMRQLLTVFHDNIDDMTVTQKRAAIRTVVRKVVWDGKVAHVVLFGSPEDEIDWTTFPVDPEEDDNDPEGGGDGSDSPSGVRWGEDSKCYPLPSALWVC